MAISGEIKEELNDTFGQAEWKRRSKKKINNLYELREFEEPNSGVVVQAFTNVESKQTLLYNGSKIIFGVAEDNDEWVVVFAEPFAFRQEEIDRDLGDIFEFIGKTPPSYLIQGDNKMFWFCNVGLHSRDQLVADLVTGGFTFDLGLANHLNEDFGGPVYKTQSLGASIAESDDTEVVTDEEDDDDDTYMELFKDQKILFAVYDQPGGDGCRGKGMTVCFNPESYWRTHGYLFDQHVQHILTTKLGFALPNYLPDEDCENSFPVWEPWMISSNDPEPYPKAITKSQVIADLTSAGFVFDQQMDTWINS
jgi:hypothetical protein